MTKVRLGFVTNSSSSSFILQKKNLTESQIEKVINHGEYIRTRKIMFDGYWNGPEDDWEIVVKEDVIEGSTTMTNFDMQQFFEYIGINKKDYKFEE